MRKDNENPESFFRTETEKEHVFNCSLLKKGHYINTLTR